MKMERLSIKSLCLLVGAGALFSMLIIIAVLFALTGGILILWGGAMLTACALIWMLLLVLLFGKRLSAFASGLCRMLDNMINGNGEPEQASDSETLFARISHRLSRRTCTCSMTANGQRRPFSICWTMR